MKLFSITYLNILIKSFFELSAAWSRTWVYRTGNKQHTIITHSCLGSLEWYFKQSYRSLPFAKCKINGTFHLVVIEIGVEVIEIKTQFDWIYVNYNAIFLLLNIIILLLFGYLLYFLNIMKISQNNCFVVSKINGRFCNNFF